MTQTVPDISPLMPMHQDPLLVLIFDQPIEILLNVTRKVRAKTPVSKVLAFRFLTICVGHLTIIGSDDDLSPGRRQAIMWTNYGILSRNKLQWNFNRNANISFKKMEFKMSSAKWRPFCLGLNVVNVDEPSAMFQVTPHVEHMGVTWN